MRHAQAQLRQDPAAPACFQALARLGGGQVCHMERDMHRLKFDPAETIPVPKPYMIKLTVYKPDGHGITETNIR